jgi:hypothetical protein
VRTSNASPDIIGVTEVKPKNYNNEINPQEYSIDGYKLYHSNVDKKIGRGILIYINNTLTAQETTMDTKFEENLFIDMKLNNNDRLLIGCIYRSESGTATNNNKLRQLIDEASTKGYSHILMMGDFNYRDINWKTWNHKTDDPEAEENLFLECLKQNDLYQHITKPTRIRGTNKPSTLDLIITNEKNMVSDVEYHSPLGKSDHSVLLFNYHCYTIINSKPRTKKYYDKANYDEIKMELDGINWEEVLGKEEDVNSQWEKLTKILKDCEEKYVPQKTINPGQQKRNRFPVDEATLAKIRLKKSLHRKMVNSGKEEDRVKYAKVRNQVKNMTNKLQKAFETNIAKESKENPKTIWKYIRSKQKTNPESPTTSDNKEKANIIADFFTSVFTIEPEEEGEEVPTLEEKNIQQPLEDLNIETTKIKKLLDKLKPDKSPGLDGLHPRFLKELSESLAVPLRILFTKSIQQKQIPKDWKMASVTPIFKKGKKCLASNYRPVSLTSIVCKTMEKIVRDHIIEHLKANNLLTNKQYGFISGRSTSLQLLTVLDEWSEALDAGNSIDCIYMDYQKAFDTVPHRRLLNKLQAYGITDPILGWIKSFLEKRKQRINVEGESSDWKDVTSGIPQGSVLGPLLFVIFINDLPEELQTSAYLFADDTKVYNIIKNKNDQENLQKDLNKLEEWSDRWLLRFHPDKCKHIHVGKQIEPNTRYYIHNKKLEIIEEEKDIGVTVDNKLSFENHLNLKVNKATGMFAMLRRTFKHIDAKSLTNLYKTLVRTHLDYASSVWAPYKVKHIEKLESVQKKATKQMPGMKELSYPERLEKLKLPTLSYRRLRGDLIEMYKLTHGIYDKETTNFIKLWENVANKTSKRGHSLKLFPQRASKEIRKNSYITRTTPKWNNLPVAVANAPTLDTFKNRLDKLYSTNDLMYRNYRADGKLTQQDKNKFVEPSEEV